MERIRRSWRGSSCRYYDARNAEDVDRLPRVTRRNVLILKYYSFENYFFDPEIMAQLGIVESEEAFYETLYKKWREYLHRLTSGQKLIKALGRDFTSPEAYEGPYGGDPDSSEGAQSL